MGCAPVRRRSGPIAVSAHSCRRFPELGMSRRPEPVEPGTDGGKAVGVDAVDAPGAFRMIAHETRRLERRQMLGHGRTADRQTQRQPADGLRALGQALEDQPPRRIGKDFKLVSHSLL